MNNISNIQSDIEKILDLQEEMIWVISQKDWDELVDSAKELDTNTQELYEDIVNSKDNILTRLFGKKFMDKVKWFTNKRIALFERYDEIIEELKANSDLYIKYISDMWCEITKLEAFSKWELTDEEKIYVDRYLLDIILSLKNTIERITIKNNTLNTTAEYMMNNKLSFRSSFNNAFIENNSQKFLKKVVWFNKSLVDVIEEVNKRQTEMAKENLILGERIKWSNLLNSASLKNNAIQIESAKKEYLLLN